MESDAKNFSVSSRLECDDSLAASSNAQPTTIIQEDGVVWYLSDFLSPSESDRLLAQSLAEIPWTQDNIRIFGRSVPVPRLSAWFSSVNATYKYSGLVHQPKPKPEFLAKLLSVVVARTGFDFNSVLVNLYRDGSDSMGWHADDEPELGSEVTIASLNVGTRRVIRFKHRHKKELRMALPVAHGSLLMMYPPLQEFWLHEVPKRKDISAPRVNFSFRTMRSS